MKQNKELVNYIEKNIFPKYDNCDKGHGIEHINYVIRRSMQFADTVPNINYDMVYTVACYHDLGQAIDHDTHEKIAADILKQDKFINSYFTKEQIEVMSEAILDHRASNKKDPRNIYGKIVSSADRNTSITSIMERAYNFRKKDITNIEQLVEECRLHTLDKFGPNGYARSKIYFKDPEYEEFLNKVVLIVSNKELYDKMYYEVNKISR